jgi:type II secretory pathway pseudopilin PulG
LEVPHAPARPRGFPLVKLLLGIAVIPVVLSVAVPVYFGGRIATIEAAVTEELRTIHRAQSQCVAQSGRYCTTLAALGSDAAKLATAAPHGYVFTMTATDSAYTASAAPQPYYGFARRTIHMDQTGEVRYSWSTVQTEEIKP